MKKLLHLLGKMGKYYLYGLVLQIIFMNVILAAESNAQGSLDIGEVKITLNLESAALPQVFEEIKNKTDFYFIYDKHLVKASDTVTLDVKEESLEDVLLLLSAEFGLSFKQVNERISVKKSKKFWPSSNENPIVVDVEISGVVTDNNGEPIPGVTVIVEGTNVGTVTDIDGQYTIQAPEGGTLVFSFVGFETQRRQVGAEDIINVSMAEDAGSLDEVVVVGYGTVKRKDLTGAVGSVNSDEIKDLAMTRIEQGLLGRQSGVQVKAVSGAPGAAPQIRIRGIGSISAGTEPLFVVDGFPTDNIQTLNPNDIESMDILKDASATAIYGSRGANGVIIINTKRGKAGTSEIRFDSFYGLQEVSRMPATMNAMEQAQYGLDGMRNRNMDAGHDVSGHPSTWQFPMPPTAMDVLEGRDATDIRMIDQILRVAPQRQHQLTASGGSENVRYAVSGEYLNQDGIIKGSDFERYSLRANIDANLTDKLSVNVNLNQSFTNENLVDESSEGNYGSWISASPVNRAQLWQPFFPAFDQTGGYYMFDHAEAAQVWHPVAMVNEIQDEQRRTRFLGNFNAKYQFTDELHFDVMAGTSLLNSNRMRFVPQLPAFAGGGSYNVATGNNDSFMNSNWITEYTLHYNKDFGPHKVSGLVGYTRQRDRTESSFMTSDRFPNNFVPTLSAVSGIITDGTSNVSEWSLVSYLARFNYNYDNKLYLTASIRTDGSSRFGMERRYGTFPSAAVAYRISEENFLRNLNSLDDLKLRISYGRTGNNNIGNYDHLALINYNRYILGNSLVAGFAPGNLANPFLTWETQDQVNFGFDLSLFDSRIFLTVDHFQSRNTDLLLDVNVPATTGFTNLMTNIGEVKNTGWELMVSTINTQGEFQWSTDFNVSTYQNEVVRLGPTGDPIYSTAGGEAGGANVTMIGQPIGMFFGFMTDGVFMTQEELAQGPVFGAGTAAESRVGDIRFVDVNGDGIIDSNDLTIMGNPYPDFYYGMTNNFTYRNFTLNATLQGSYGNDILNMSGIGQLNMRGARVLQSATQNDYWRSEQEPGDGVTPRPNDAPTGNNRAMSQRYLDTGTFLRFTNITLSYMFPQSVAESMKLGSLRVYLNSNNPFTFSRNRTSFNPDVSNSGNALHPGIDFDDYPLPRSIILGINVGF
jgi:TonB-linked SusC/RagA family outer membrane protein